MSGPEKKLRSLLAEAIQLDSTEAREDFLKKSCGEDLELRARLEKLLETHTDAHGDVTLVPDTCVELPTEAHESARPSAPEKEKTVVAGNAGQSVLMALGKTIEIPRVTLREPGAELAEPIQRPSSPEIPERASDGRYQLQGEIARGGMGAIIKGRDIDLGRDLAIKVLLDDHKNKPEVIQRFVEEAQIGGQLQHPGIAPVYELGQFADQRPFFSMKLVKGKTLAKLLAERKDPADDRSKFIGVFEQICQTMAYAHSRGVIHRDLKTANIMVGAFGEVQVMDWGLAKVLTEGGVADERKVLGNQREHSVIETRRTVGSDVPGSVGSAGSETQMGSVLGTPAYMPPEQALGEVDQLDQRADVFGLGAILCEILTGKPPYVGQDGTQVYRLASRGKLKDCFQRLDACCADAELIALAKHCLELEPDDRPQDAAALADRITLYQESVEIKLRETEMQRAADAARAIEERKRRRLLLAVTAAGVLLLGLSGGGWLYLEKQQSERQVVAEMRMNKALMQARLHQQSAAAADIQDTAGLNLRVRELDQALRSAKDAVDLARQERVADELRQTADDLWMSLEKDAASAREQAEQAVADRKFQEELELIRLTLSGGKPGNDSPPAEGESEDGRQQQRVWDAGDTTGILLAGSKVDRESAPAMYQWAFYNAGLDVAAADISQAAEWIRESAISESLIAALDNWTRFLPADTDENSRNGVTRSRLVAISNAADSSRWRMQLRSALTIGDTAALRQLAAQDKESEPSSALLAWLGFALREGGLLEEAVSVLRVAQLQNPNDFWLNSELVKCHELRLDHVASVGYARAALARRAQSVGAWLQLAYALRLAEQYDEAVAACRQAIALDPNNAVLHRNLGSILRDQDKLDEAIVAYRTAIEFDPEYPRLYHSLGLTLSMQGEHDEAITTFRKAVELEPVNSQLRYNFGRALSDHNQLEEAIAEFREAIAIDPDHLSARHYLGLALSQQGKLDEAIAEYQKATELSPNSTLSHFYLAYELAEQGKREEAIAAYRTVIKLDPAEWLAYHNLGFLLEDSEEKITAWQKTIELNPSLDTEALYYLGEELHQVERPEEALAVWIQALERDVMLHETLSQIALHLNQQRATTVDSLRSLIGRIPDNPELLNGVAWLIVTTPDEDVRYPESADAVDWAQRACRLKADDFAFLNTLGVAFYRAERWREAIDTLQQSIENGGDLPYNWLFLAMANWESEERPQAHAWYDKSLAWRTANEEAAQQDDELLSFFHEAADLMRPAEETEEATESHEP